MLLRSAPYSRLCENLDCELKYVVVKKSQIVLISLMLFAAGSCLAMSLGRHRGVALIGRPLDISVQAILDGQEDLAVLCLEANVFYADNKVSQSRVQVTAERVTPGGQDAIIRIRSAAQVDEPVITIYLRAGCQQKTEKRYVLLADLASEVLNGPAFVSPGATAAVTALGQPRGNAAGNNAAPAVVAATDALPARTTRRTRLRSADAAVDASNPMRISAAEAVPNSSQPVKRDNQRAKNAKAAEKAAGKGDARLKLVPLDLSIERDPQLRPSSELLSVPSSNPQERSAAAALWRALTTQSQDIQRDAERLQTLESSIRGLQAQSQKNGLAIEALNGQVKQARAERYSNPLVYALGFLLLLALAALAFVTWRWVLSRKGASDELPWWRKSAPEERGWANSAQEAEIPAVPGRAASRKGAQKYWGAKEKVLDLDLSANEAGLGDVRHLSPKGGPDSLLPLSRIDRADFGASMSYPVRAVKAEELFDVQQQADFFLSLGQHEQAIAVLRNHINDNVQTSALVYLDLFNIYHQLMRQADYEALRGDFNQRFNAKIPAFELYDEVGAGLEAYQAALTRIETLWPSPKVLEVIEESLFRRPDGGAETFNLEAYRELLMLYSVAREIISPETAASVARPKFDLPDLPDDYELKTTKFLSTSIQPLSASVVDEWPQAGKREPLLPAIMPPASSRLGLDLDLSDFGGIGESAAPEVESDSHFFAQFTADLPIEKPPLANQLPSGAAAKIDNLIDFDAFDSSVPDAHKAEPPER